MSSHPIDSLLSDYSRLPLPEVSPSLQTDVWRAIEAHQTPSIWQRLRRLVDVSELFAHPRLAILALTCAMITGITPVALKIRADDEQRLARRSVHFEAFSPRATGQLASLFEQRELGKLKP